MSVLVQYLNRGLICFQASKEKAENPQATETGVLHCCNCNSTIGTEDPSANGWRLLKANVSLAANETSQEIQSHSAEVIIAAQLLELVERESARRFVVHCRQKYGLLVRRVSHIYINSC